jgi:hypothetical protein
MDNATIIHATIYGSIGLAFICYVWSKAQEFVRHLQQQEAKLNAIDRTLRSMNTNPTIHTLSVIQTSLQDIDRKVPGASEDDETQFSAEVDVPQLVTHIRDLCVNINTIFTSIDGKSGEIVGLAKNIVGAVAQVQHLCADVQKAEFDEVCQAIQKLQSAIEKIKLLVKAIDDTTRARSSKSDEKPQRETFLEGELKEDADTLGLMTRDAADALKKKHRSTNAPIIETGLKDDHDKTVQRSSGTSGTQSSMITQTAVEYTENNTANTPDMASKLEANNDRPSGLLGGIRSINALVSKSRASNVLKNRSKVSADNILKPEGHQEGTIEPLGWIVGHRSQPISERPTVDKLAAKAVIEGNVRKTELNPAESSKNSPNSRTTSHTHGHGLSSKSATEGWTGEGYDGASYVSYNSTTLAPSTSSDPSPTAGTTTSSHQLLIPSSLAPTSQPAQTVVPQPFGGYLQESGHADTPRPRSNNPHPASSQPNSPHPSAARPKNPHITPRFCENGGFDECRDRHCQLTHRDWKLCWNHEPNFCRNLRCTHRHVEGQRAKTCAYAPCHWEFCAFQHEPDQRQPIEGFQSQYDGSYY